MSAKTAALPAQRLETARAASIRHPRRRKHLAFVGCVAVVEAAWMLLLYELATRLV